MRLGFGVAELRPVGAIQGAVLDGFGDVLGFDGRSFFDVGDGAGDFEDAVVGAGAESLLGHGALEQAFAVGGKFAEGADVAGGDLGAATKAFWGGNAAGEVLFAGRARSIPLSFSAT